MQEELNELSKVACLTCRFSSDRPETVFKVHTNVLVPPMSKEWIVSMVDYIYKSDDARKTLMRPNKIYGKNVGDKIANIFWKLMNNGSRPFRWAHEALNLWKEDSKFSYL